MVVVCDKCGKGKLNGLTHKHHRGVAGGRWKQKAPKVKRIFKPNLKNYWVEEGGKRTKMRLCTKCIKRIKFDTAKISSPPTSLPA